MSTDQARAGHPRPLPAPLTEPIDPEVRDGTADAQQLQTQADRVARGGARAAVLGVNDGLVTNVCVILALAGASADASAVRLAGFASLIAGAFSMAAGEWVSVRSQVELYEGILAELRRLVARNPKLVLDQLVDHLEDAGFGRATAQRASTELPLDADTFFAFTARTVFGLNPDELGSPRVAAGSSFALFGVGAFTPLLPWFVTSGSTATVISVLLTALGSVAVGSWVARSGGRSLVFGAIRQLTIVAAAAAVTYAIGALFGTAVA
ncbi:MAG: VIT1/CCC1 transporter family protein [Acidimicrobiales bacterium]